MRFIRQHRSLRPLWRPQLLRSCSSFGPARMMGALAVTVVCAAAVPVPAAAEPSPSSSATASPGSGAGGGSSSGSTSLPPMPLTLKADAPCTGASERTAEAVTTSQLSLSLPSAWQLSRGAGVTVAVVDTGVSAAAPALSGRVTAVGDAGDDCVGHGTFTAGLVAAAQMSGTAFHGVAPAARVLAVRGTDERGAATPGRVADGIRAAVDQDAQVITVSAALPAGEDELTAAVRYATEHDVLVVAAAVPDVRPKSGEAASTYWPASAPGALSVVGVPAEGGAPDSAPAAGADLAAPGGPVVGIGPRGSGHYIATGSSEAAAFAAGAAALVRSYHPDLTAAETANRLTTSAAPTGNAPRLDPYAAVAMVPPGRAPHAAPPRTAPLQLPAVSATPRNRALLAAGCMALLVVVVATGVAVIPRGRARGWRPPS